MKGRRELLIALGSGVFLAPLVCFGQQKVHRIGILVSDSPETRGFLVEIFIQAMRELGYVEGRNMVYEARYAGGDIARLAAFAAELANLNLDVIVVPNGPSVEAAARAAEEARRPVAIVFSGWGTPLSNARLVASLARPGGYVTGVTNDAQVLAGKQLQLLKDAFPKISRLAAFVGLTTARLGPRYFKEVERAASTLGMHTLPLEVRGGDDVERNVALMRKWRADSIFVATNPQNFGNRKALIRIAQVTGLPAVYGQDVSTEAGALMS
jgi:putative ABC transport system substrate-binding protein